MPLQLGASSHKPDGYKDVAPCFKYTVAYSQATRCISSPPDITISATELETMVKTQWYKRRCAPYLKLKDFLKSQRVSRSSGPTTTTSSPNSAKISSRPTAASTEKRLRKITRTFTPVQIEETFNRKADVAIKDGDSSSWSDYNKGVIMFDTGSVYNLVTVRFLETFDIAWEPSTDDTMIIQMDEKRLNCLGEVEGRWRTLNASQEGFRPRYEISTFKIVDVDAFELIIGSRTIKELKIFQLNRTFFGGFKAVPIRPDSPGTAKKRKEEYEAKLRKEKEDVKKSMQEQKQKNNKPNRRTA